jgi:hypothetical protein
MRNIERTSVEVLGCARQEVVVIGGVSYWRWIAPGCPFGRPDVEASCTSCKHFAVTQPANPIDGAPVDSGLPYAV